MTIQECAVLFGIESYPEGLDGIGAENWECICDPNWIAQLEETYGVCGEYLELIQKAAADLPRDPARFFWAKAACAYLHKCQPEDAKEVPFPETDGTPAGDMLPLFPLLSRVPVASKRYERFGFHGEQLRQIWKMFPSDISVVKKKMGRPGINRQYYRWLCLFATAMIFKHGGFQFQFKYFEEKALLLKNRETGEFVPVMYSGTFHRSGMVLGCAGLTDPEGSFPADFQETEDAFYGHGVSNYRAEPERRCFPKAQWECVLRPGEPVLALHIPRHADLTEEATKKAFAEGLALARQYDPERAPKCVVCNSWLLDPGLEDILGPEARIPQFGKRFVRYPIRSLGKHVFGFVFPPVCDDLQTLPENTRLERGLKQLYLNGGFNYSFGGIVPPEDA